MSASSILSFMRLSEPVVHVVVVSLRAVSVDKSKRYPEDPLMLSV